MELPTSPKRKRSDDLEQQVENESTPTENEENTGGCSHANNNADQPTEEINNKKESENQDLFEIKSLGSLDFPSFGAEDVDSELLDKLLLEINQEVPLPELDPETIEKILGSCGVEEASTHAEKLEIEVQGTKAVVERYCNTTLYNSMKQPLYHMSFAHSQTIVHSEQTYTNSAANCKSHEGATNVKPEFENLTQTIYTSLQPIAHVKEAGGTQTLAEGEGVDGNVIPQSTNLD